MLNVIFFFFSSRRRHTRSTRDWSSDVCSSDLFVGQTPLWEPVVAFDAVQVRKRELRARLGLDAAKLRWPVSRERLEQSGIFRYVRELALHSVEQADGERLVGFALSEGSMRTLLEAGATEEDVGLDRLRAAAAAIPEPVPWWIGYRVWLGL